MVEADELKLKGALAELRGFMRAVEMEGMVVTVKDRRHGVSYFELYFIGLG